MGRRKDRNGPWGSKRGGTTGLARKGAMREWRRRLADRGGWGKIPREKEEQGGKTE